MTDVDDNEIALTAFRLIREAPDLDRRWLLKIAALAQLYPREGT